MRIGIALPTMVAGLDRDTLLTWMREVDAGPFSVLGVGERIAYPNQEVMTTLAAAAAVTERVGIMATVSVLPMHSAVHVAKQAATIDVLSNGRFTLGVGVGGRDEDYRALGAPFARRLPRLDEQVAAVRAVWRGEAPADDVGPVGPSPVQPDGPRILASSMGPKSMARSVQWSDGLAGFDMSADPTAIGQAVRDYSQAWTDAGRAGRPFLQSSAWFGLGDDAAEAVPAYAFRYLRIFGDEIATMLAGMQRLTSPQAIRDNLAAIADLGVDEFILAATSPSIDDLRRAADLIGEASIDPTT
jgi:alkanesulfonate monooxygenase SsuD/methylene tetrahydromethanopterin reductase-like flavin-dependent oxidoreductase (luciferase family)